MNILSTKVHGILDYLIGALLIASPWIFNLDVNSAEGLVPVILGVSTVVYSLITSYELSISDILSLKAHLRLDEIAGIFLAISPWLFGFSEQTYLPHVLIGALEFIVAICTVTQPYSVPSITKHTRHRTIRRSHNAHA